jgi:hypothetical protein
VLRDVVQGGEDTGDGDEGDGVVEEVDVGDCRASPQELLCLRHQFF